MKAQILSAILTCFYLSLVRGLDHNVTHKNWISDSSRRVIHGDIAVPTDYKFVVRVQAYIYVCGGSVISKNFILTGARCVHGQVCELTKIFPSTWTLYDETELRAAECWYHEKHDNARPEFYDVGILKTKDDLLKDPHFKVIPLAAPGVHHVYGTPAVIVGWGETEAGVEAMHLRKADVRVDNWIDCNEKFKNKRSLCTPDGKHSDENIPKAIICTQGRDSKPSGICTNDFGGPLVVDGVVAGIISSTYPDAKRNCADGAPSLHTNVADYLPWIYGIIEPERDTSNIIVVNEETDKRVGRR